MSGDCGKRAFEAGLRWCGINDTVPDVTHTDEIESLANQYGLTFVKEKQHIFTFNHPVLVTYKDDYTHTDSLYHCVFATDSAPFARWEVHSMVIGWERLRAKSTATRPSKIRNSKPLN